MWSKYHDSIGSLNDCIIAFDATVPHGYICRADKNCHWFAVDKFVDLDMTESVKVVDEIKLLVSESLPKCEFNLLTEGFNVTLGIIFG